MPASGSWRMLEQFFVLVKEIGMSCENANTSVCVAYYCFFDYVVFDIWSNGSLRLVMYESNFAFVKFVKKRVMIK
jgi:hypothetical protein